jgi:hypothetical protein
VTHVKLEKLKGYEKTSIYTIYVTGNYKIPWKLRAMKLFPSVWRNIMRLTGHPDAECQKAYVTTHLGRGRDKPG